MRPDQEVWNGEGQNPQGDWVVVCDGGKALMLENIGDEVFANLKTRETHGNSNPPTREQGTGEPGRVFQSVGGARSAMEQADRHEQSEHEFLTRLAARLDAAVKAGQVKSLIIVAPPRALGLIRNAYTPALRAAVKAEIDKDLVRMPVHQIEKHLLEKDLVKS
jgi:protein required for attachment to host cells